MRSSSALILLAVLVTFSAGPVLAQDALNETGAINVTNATNVTVVADVAPVEEAAAPLMETVQASEVAPQAAEATPQVAEVAPDVAEATPEVTEVAPQAAEAAPQVVASRFKQLSTFVKGETTVLGKNAAQEYTDVSQNVSRDTVFTREAGAYTPSVKVGITWVNTAEDKYVQVANQAVGSWDLTGWTLASAENTTFTFPALTLEEKSSVRVHEGEGAGSATDIYTNSTAPLWIDNLVSLQNADGSIISTYDVSMAPAAAKWVDPLARQIQY
jgi:hypothetical protein